MKTNININDLQFINVLEDSFELWQYCKENNFTDCKDYEEFYNNGGDLSFFEGDPDIIKLDGETGYFCLCGNKVFYYFDDCMTHKAEELLKAFYSGLNCQGVTLGGESYICGSLPEDFENCQSWKDFEKISTGIAFRGGAGYIYSLYDCQRWASNNLN